MECGGLGSDDDDDKLGEAGIILFFVMKATVVRSMLSEPTALL